MDKLRPISFEKLMAMALEEYQAFGTVFGVRKMYKAGRARLPIFGMRIENPIGPAASPVTQTSQGIIAAYLSGARFIELKTVSPRSKQVKKPYATLEIPSLVSEAPSELSVGDAFNEYVKAWYAIKLLSAHFELGVPEGFVFQMSVGGCLGDLKSEKMNSFIEGLKSAEYTEVWRECENWARAHVDEFNGIDNMYVSDVSPQVSSSVTFVPNEGLTPEEIEECAKYLIEEKHLHTFIKLSPEYLGYYNIRGILDINGYSDIEIDEDKINNNYDYEGLRPALNRLQSDADSKRLEFGVKVSDGLHIKTEGKEGFLTGKALFPIAFSLAEKISNDFGGGLRICYSGGADKLTTAKLYSTGIWPVLFASDLMMPGGLLRLHEMASEVGKLDYQQFSGILTSDLPDLEKEFYENGRYKNGFRGNPIKSSEKAPMFRCRKAECREACPLDMDIPYIERLIKGNRQLEAIKAIFERCPMPFTTSLLCPHYCTDSCTRRFYEAPIDIHNEIYKAAEEGSVPMLDETEPLDAAGEPVAIVGAGAAGICAALYMVKQGKRVTVFDKSQRPGGALTEYIPSDILKEKDIEWDITLMQAHGIDMELEYEIHSVKELLDMGYEKVIIATGLPKEKTYRLSFGKPVSALDFLKDICKDKEESEEKYQGSIVIYGSGISAITAARAAKNLPSADRVTLISDSAIKDEAISAKDKALLSKEGIFLIYDRIPYGLKEESLFCHIANEGKKDKKTGITELIKTDEKEKITCDLFINATGEIYDTSIKDEELAYAKVGAASMGFNSYLPFVIKDAQQFCSKFVHSHYDKYLLANETSEEGFMEKRGEQNEKQKQCEKCLECETYCGFCSDVCPNRANLTVKLSEGNSEIIHIDEFCDECGICKDACPYSEDPSKSKFTLFLDEEDFSNSDREGFFVTGEANNCKFRMDGKVFKYDPINGPDGIVSPEVKETASLLMKLLKRTLKN